MRRFSFLVLFLFSASGIGLAQGRSGSAASSSSSSSSSAASSHSSGSSGGSSTSHSGGGSSASSHSSGGISHSAGGGSKARSSPASSNHPSRQASSNSSHSGSPADRDSSRIAGNQRLGSENVKAKPEQPIATKVNPQPPTTKPHHWLARLFRRRQPELAKAPKPCIVGKNCPSPPPKPCTGQKCPPPPPPPCGPGTVSNGHGACVATNHANDVCTTNPLAYGCPQSLFENQYAICAPLRTQLEQAIMEQDRLRQAMNVACLADPQSNECMALRQRYNAAELEVDSLRQRLMTCRS